MKEKDYGVHIMTQDEWNESEKTITKAEKDAMDVENYFRKEMLKRANLAGKIPDEEWMKTL